MIQKPCYFYIDTTAPGEERIRAVCVKCHDEKVKTGWFWNKQYGDYDLQCHLCKDTIHQRDKEYIESL